MMRTLHSAIQCCPASIVCRERHGRRSTSCRHKRLLPAVNAGAGFAGTGGNNDKPSSINKSRIVDSRKAQLEVGELLSMLLNAQDPEAVARSNVESLNENFFNIAAAYVSMAEKEGSTEVVQEMQRVLKVAMAAKNATLRPEIRLLNQLLACEGDALKRKQLLNRVASREALESDNGYFFKLLERMTTDVGRQGSGQQPLLQQLQDIKREATLRLQPL